jgi:hypothetical protein
VSEHGPYSLLLTFGVMGCAFLLGVAAALFAVAPWSTPGRTSGSVTVDVGDLPGPDCWFEVGQVDRDGKPGGSKGVSREVLCP